MALRLPVSPFSPVHGYRRKLVKSLRCSAENQTQSQDARRLVLQIKEKLEREHPTLPAGKNGRDDEDMILWFLKDRRFSVEDAVAKLTKAIKWRQDFGVSELSEESVKSLYGTGKAYLHDFLDINGRPVLVVVASKHFPAVGIFLHHNQDSRKCLSYSIHVIVNDIPVIIWSQKQDPSDNEKLSVFLIEKALRKLPSGTEEILVIIDLRGFRVENADVQFLKFLIDVFYYYYPKRLGQVLFVDAPFVFLPIWQLVKPLLKSYAFLVRFCNMETVRKEYFTEETAPADFW
ncbi:uncharacterized protein [Elaeis guineensis]|uniref:Motile sperm domain-containing protein 2 isoform X2 n=1 Tax=Elaeis guineensis var. tenera TaxID=51953 RepID=A0A6I9S3T6_ELAGV|nr:motile sperm domain-containing protein 2 isoform X2 [Elaeis guineensis]